MTLKADTPIDLQLHTVYSDGTWTPEALLDHLQAEGFGLAAITDHDRVDTVPRLQTLAAEKGFRLLVATELTTMWGDAYVDLLCFGFDPSATPLNALVDELATRQTENVRRAAEIVAERGYTLPQETVDAILTQPTVQQPHSLVALVQEHYEDLQAVLGGTGLTTHTVEIGAAVEATHQSGGVCLIAHPGREDHYVKFDAASLDNLRAEVPIDGLEVHYPKHSAEQVAMYRAYADEHNLLTSAGSDSHGPDKPPVKYRADSCRTLLARLGIDIT